MFVSRSDVVSHTRSLCLSASFYVFVRAQGKTDRKPSKTKAESNTHDTERKRKRTRGTEREWRNEEKAYYQQTDGPPIHSGPAGTWRDNSLHLRVTSAAERGGALKQNSVCVRFCLLTCKQKANLWHLWQGAMLSSILRFPRSSCLKTVSFRCFCYILRWISEKASPQRRLWGGAVSFSTADAVKTTGLAYSKQQNNPFKKQHAHTHIWHHLLFNQTHHSTSSPGELMSQHP